jgi:hypothetical protein
LLSKNDLENPLNKQGISNQDRLLLCLALTPMKPRMMSEIRTIGASAGWRGAAKTNLSRYLLRATSLAILVEDGWKLTDLGKVHVAGIAGSGSSPAATVFTQGLRKELVNLLKVDTRDFVEEAIRAAEYGLWRSAVILSWVGAVAVLHEHVVVNRLADFNHEMTKRNAK